FGRPFPFFLVHHVFDFVIIAHAEDVSVLTTAVLCLKNTVVTTVDFDLPQDVICLIVLFPLFIHEDHFTAVDVAKDMHFLGQTLIPVHLASSVCRRGVFVRLLHDGVEHFLHHVPFFLVFNQVDG